MQAVRVSRGEATKNKKLNPMRDYVGPEVWGNVLTGTRISGPGSVALDRDSRRFICTCRGLQGEETVFTAAAEGRQGE